MALPGRLTLQQEAFRKLLVWRGLRPEAAEHLASTLSSHQSPHSFAPPPDLHTPDRWARIKRGFFLAHLRYQRKEPDECAPLNDSSHAAIRQLQAMVKLLDPHARLEISGVHRRLSSSAPQPLSLLLIVPPATKFFVKAADAALPGTAADAAWRARQWVESWAVQNNWLRTTRYFSPYRPLFLNDEARTPVDLHATTSLAAGAAQLLLTGDDRFAAFLINLAEEGFGMRLDMHGLWTRPGLAADRAERRAARSAAAPRGVPRGVQMRSFLDDEAEQQAEPYASALSPALEALSLTKPSREGEAREAGADAALEARRERNRAMGLPPDFDSGLSLGSGPSSSLSSSPASSPASPASPAEPQTPPAEEKEPKFREDLYDPSWRRLCPEASEELILDTLGLAYLPPEARVSNKGKSDGPAAPLQPA